MSEQTMTIRDALIQAQNEILSMRFGPQEGANFQHAQAALNLISAVAQWYGQAEAKARAEDAKKEKGNGTSSAAAAASSPEGEDGAETEPGCERNERECEA